MPKKFRTGEFCQIVAGLEDPVVAIKVLKKRQGGQWKYVGRRYTCYGVWDMYKKVR